MPDEPFTADVRQVSVSFRGRRALDQVSFRLRSGVTGLLGPNGAGKTTLLRTLATALAPDSGELSVLGHDPRQATGRLAIRRRLGYLPQNPGFHPQFTARDFVDYVAILKEIVDRTARRREVQRVLAVVGLADQQNKRMKALSGGMRQRVALAAAILGEPELLILDEPTVGLDPEQRLRFRELIAELGESRTVLLSTHQTDDVAALCRRVIVLDSGVTSFDGPPAGLVAVATDRVWTSNERDGSALAGWRTGDGVFRNIGDPPPGAALATPTLEDGYLLLLEGKSAASLGTVR
ncbi:ABC transporter ATP-binding protein [Hamadaea sp. NPDC051192]|uniref:ABC transporter ATP-binding protein n=1 Tax=Hamadaea sp. NPDC051192 TaxID=3154940 RepID=UPI00341B328A